jgi:hypothetical protein
MNFAPELLNDTQVVPLGDLFALIIHEQRPGNYPKQISDWYRGSSVLTANK